MAAKAVTIAMVASGLLASAAPSARGEGWKAPLAIYGGLAGADLLSTEAAIKAGAAEANPLMRGGRGARLAISTVSVLTLSWVDRRLPSRRARIAYRLAVAAVRVAAITTNIRNAWGPR